MNWALDSLSTSSLTLTLTSPDGDQGYPGEVKVSLCSSQFYLDQTSLVVCLLYPILSSHTHGIHVADLCLLAPRLLLAHSKYTSCTGTYRSVGYAWLGMIKNYCYPLFLFFILWAGCCDIWGEGYVTECHVHCHREQGHSHQPRQPCLL